MYPDRLPFDAARAAERKNEGNAKFAVKSEPKVGIPIRVFEFEGEGYRDTGEVIPTRVRGKNYGREQWFYIEIGDGNSFIVKLRPWVRVARAR